MNSRDSLKTPLMIDREAAPDCSISASQIRETQVIGRASIATVLKRACYCILALAGLIAAQAWADDGDPYIPPVNPGAGYIGIYPNPTLPPDYVKDQSTSPWGLTTMYNAVPELRIGQRFTAGLNSIDWVGFVFQSTDQGGAIGPAEYRVRIAQSIDPTTGHLIDVLGTSSSEIIQMLETGWFLFEFPESVALTPGASYYLSIDYVSGYPGGPGGTGIGVGGRTDNVYSGGNYTGFWDSEFGIAVLPTANRDLIFCTGVMLAPTTVPPAPILTATAGHAEVTLTWTASAGARSYTVKRSTTSGGPHELVGTTGARFYVDENAVNGTTYYYVVSAVNTLGESDSNEAAATPQAPPPPSAPDLLTATAISTTQIALTWRDNSTDETGFQIERSTGGGNFTLVSTVAANATSANMTGLAPATGYTFRVRAISTVAGASGYSNEASATTLALPPPPAAPTGLSATLIPPTRIDLAWTDNANNETGFKIERSTDGVNFSLISTVGANVASYSNTGLSGVTTYYYRVRASNSSGDSAYSGIASATTGAEGVLQQNASGGNKIDIKQGQKGAQSFRHGTAGNPGYFVTKVVLRLSRDSVLPNANVSFSIGTGINSGAVSGSSVSIAPSQISNTSAGSSFMTLQIAFPVPVGPLTAGSTYYLNLACEASNGKAIYAEQAGGNAYSGGSYFKAGGDDGKDIWFQVLGNGAAPTAPPAPTGLAATAGHGQASLSWTASAGATSYTVKRATTSGGVYTIIATGVTSTTYANAGLNNGTTYYYVVTAVNSVGESPNSNQASATPQAPAAPATPTGLAAVVGNAQVSLTWAAATGATGYNVKRATVSGGPYSLVATGVASTSYANTGLANGTTYYYVVSAVNGSGESANSGQASATPQAPAGGALQQSIGTGNKADIKQSQTGSQSFRHGSAGGAAYTVSKLVLHLSRESEAPDADLEVSIGTGRNSGALAGSTVAISPSSITNTSAGSSFQTFEVTFASPVGLTAGTTYYINLACEGPNGKTVYLELSGGNSYASGTYFEGESDQGKDAWFQVWGQ